MLILKSRRATSYKCPRHPRQKYANRGSLPASCDTCHAIMDIAVRLDHLERAERTAERSAARIQLRTTSKQEISPLSLPFCGSSPPQLTGAETDRERHHAAKAGENPSE